MSQPIHGPRTFLGNPGEFHVRTIHRVLKVHPSGYRGWIKEPLCPRGREDLMLAQKIQGFFDDSGQAYGRSRI